MNYSVESVFYGLVAFICCVLFMWVLHGIRRMLFKFLGRKDGRI